MASRLSRPQAPPQRPGHAMASHRGRDATCNIDTTNIVNHHDAHCQSYCGLRGHTARVDSRGTDPARFRLERTSRWRRLPGLHGAPPAAHVWACAARSKCKGYRGPPGSGLRAATMKEAWRMVDEDGMEVEDEVGDDSDNEDEGG
eukprot:5806214-Prymnesium_polylepis.2